MKICFRINLGIKNDAGIEFNIQFNTGIHV